MSEYMIGLPDHPTLAEQERLRDLEYELDEYGRPLHPWLHDPNFDVPAGRGNLWRWGPNYTADPIVINTDEIPKILLIQRGDNGAWALPGGFVNEDEAAAEAAARELNEEASMVVSGEPREIYRGIVADPRATMHAWIETTALLWRIEGTPGVQADDDAQDAQWFALDELPYHLHGSHAMLIERALTQLDDSVLVEDR